MNQPLFTHTPLQEAFAALARDLIDDDGPRISTMRNYRFAIVQYDPVDEFNVRGEVQRLTGDLVANGWIVLPIDLQKLLLDRVRAQGADWVESRHRDGAHDEPSRTGTRPELPEIEARAARSKALKALRQTAAGSSASTPTSHPDHIDRTLALIGRAGALYPFFRSSALLKHLDGKTRNVPVVLLYPGQRRGPTGLSFMGVIDPDNDYRPRIYP